MAKQYQGKFITRTHDIINDYNTRHFPDLVIHSKALISMLISLALKRGNVEWDFRNGKNISYEQKLEHMFDAGWISEEVFDNCINALSLRNPIEHIYTYPNEFFAKGAAAAALALYYSLQVVLDLPHVPKLEPLREEFKTSIPQLLHIKLSRIFLPGEYEKLTAEIQSNAGGYFVIMDFPEGSHINGKPFGGLKLDLTVAYSPLLVPQLSTWDLIELVEWAGVDVFPDYPHNKEFMDEQYPHLAKK